VIEAPPDNKRFANMAGIVSVSGQPLDFGFEWPDSMMPIGNDYTAIERAVAECAYAGCESVWIVCNKDIQPLIKHRIGDYVHDPSYVSRSIVVNPSDHKIEIPIFYVPVHPKDRFKRDCLGWGTLYGALSAYYITRKISRWTVPDKFYAAFPYGVYDPALLRNYKAEITANDRFFLSFAGQTVQNGLYLGFTFNAEDFKRFRRDVRKYGTGIKVPGQIVGEGEIPLERLPVEERWSARHFSLDKVFGSAIIEESKVAALNEYHCIDSWDGYRKFMASELQLERPNYILKRKFTNRLFVG
tara:strand:+ start:2309 stop:3205 length:897 start_codon:yes stop_codon:yes gene_type:complete